PPILRRHRRSRTLSSPFTSRSSLSLSLSLRRHPNQCGKISRPLSLPLYLYLSLFWCNCFS
ncbi:unnamed protein product, partial [Musa banksii]